MSITDEQIDTIKELINIGINSSADVLNTMLELHVQLQVSSLKVVLSGDLEKEVEVHEAEQLLDPSSTARICNCLPRRRL